MIERFTYGSVRGLGWNFLCLLDCLAFHNAPYLLKIPRTSFEISYSNLNKNRFFCYFYSFACLWEKGQSKNVSLRKFKYDTSFLLIDIKFYLYFYIQFWLPYFHWTTNKNESQTISITMEKQFLKTAFSTLIFSVLWGDWG